MNEVKIDIIGIGNMGYTHAKNIFDGKINHLKLAAVCDIDLNKLNKAKEDFPGVLTFDNKETLINSKTVEAIIIATTHYYHTEIAIKAFKAGLNALTEKPAGVRASDVTEMNNAAKASGKVFGIMWNQRTNPLFLKNKETNRKRYLGQYETRCNISP